MNFQHGKQRGRRNYYLFSYVMLLKCRFEFTTEYSKILINRENKAESSFGIWGYWALMKKTKPTASDRLNITELIFKSTKGFCMKFQKDNRILLRKGKSNWILSSKLFNFVVQFYFNNKILLWNIYYFYWMQSRILVLLEGRNGTIKYIILIIEK